MKYMNNINRLYCEDAAEHDREKFKGIAICIFFCRRDKKEKFSLRSMMHPFVHFVYSRWLKKASKRGNVSVLCDDQLYFTAGWKNKTDS